jgi:hypothetical protein
MMWKHKQKIISNRESLKKMHPSTAPNAGLRAQLVPWEGCNYYLWENAKVTTGNVRDAAKRSGAFIKEEIGAGKTGKEEVSQEKINEKAKNSANGEEKTKQEAMPLNEAARQPMKKDKQVANNQKAMILWKPAGIPSWKEQHAEPSDSKGVANCLFRKATSPEERMAKMQKYRFARDNGIT